MKYIFVYILYLLYSNVDTYNPLTIFTLKKLLQALLLHTYQGGVDWHPTSVYLG